MRRRELMRVLSGHIPSVSRDYKRWGKPVNKEEDLLWLFLDDLSYDSLPNQIPSDFLEGILAERDGSVWTAQTITNKYGPGRKVNLQVTDFGLYGNEHKYGELIVSGVEWRRGETSIVSSYLAAVENRVRRFWKMNLRKIIHEGDSYAGSDGFDIGDGTERFDSLSELYCTAAYVSLLRVEGPFVLYLCDSVYVPRKEEIMLKVGRNGAVYLGPVLKPYLKEIH